MNGSMLDALRLMVGKYPGGRPALAVRLNKSDDTLRKELAGLTNYKMGAHDANEISAMCIEARSEDCYAYLIVLNASAGGHFMQLPSLDHLSGDTRRGFNRVLREFSDVVDEVAEIDDGHDLDRARRGPTLHQVRKVRKEWLELVGVGNEFVRSLDIERAALKPKHGRVKG
ncbi:hypothetical protein BH10PSE18_BH10PSE18_15090 [soil metagenome]